MAHISWQDQVRTLLKDRSKVDKLKTASGKTYKDVTEDILKKEAERLRDCIQKYIDLYYTSNDPDYYVRTFGLQHSLDSNDFRIQVDSETKFISISFDEGLSFGSGSVVKGGEAGFTPWLIDQGWKDGSRTKPHFLGYSGFNFMERAIEEWEREKEYDVIIDKSNWIYE